MKQIMFRCRSKSTGNVLINAVNQHLDNDDKDHRTAHKGQDVIEGAEGKEKVVHTLNKPTLKAGTSVPK